jgi:hypothetical protein
MCRLRMSKHVSFSFPHVELISRVLSLAHSFVAFKFPSQPHSPLSRFMLRPFSDSRQLLRCIHPNISYRMAGAITTHFCSFSDRRSYLPDFIFAQHGQVCLHRDVDDKFYRTGMCSSCSHCRIAQPLLNFATCVFSLPK